MATGSLAFTAARDSNRLSESVTLTGIRFFCLRCSALILRGMLFLVYY